VTRRKVELLILPSIVLKGRDFELVIRKIRSSSEQEEIYRVFAFKSVDSPDELLLYPDIAEIIADKIVQLEQIDSHRWKMTVTKTQSKSQSNVST
jgi:hypothetical protein